jgi:hypothetical protein
MRRSGKEMSFEQILERLSQQEPSELTVNEL